MKNLFTVKSSDCSILLSRLQTSTAYSRIGRHLCFEMTGLEISHCCHVCIHGDVNDDDGYDGGDDVGTDGIFLPNC